MSDPTQNDPFPGLPRTHIVIEHPHKPGMMLATTFNLLAADPSVTEEQAAQASQEIRALLDSHGFTSCVVPVIIYDRFWGVNILADDVMPLDWGIGATYKDVPVLFDVIQGGVKAFLARLQQSQPQPPMGPS